MRADAARNRLKVLDAARAAFAEHGRNAQMDDVARRAGVGVGTVYRHFPTKESLALALIDQRFESMLAFIRDELLVDPDPWRAIERSFEFCATTQEADRGYADVVASVAGGDPIVGGGPRGPSAARMVEMMELTEQLMARAHAAGAVRSDLVAADMPPFYAGLASVVQAGVANWRRYVELLLDGLRPEAGPRGEADAGSASRGAAGSPAGSRPPGAAGSRSRSPGAAASRSRSSASSRGSS